MKGELLGVPRRGLPTDDNQSLDFFDDEIPDPTMSGFKVICVMSQPAPTFCIHVPVYEMTEASQRERKRGSPSGDHAETGRLVPICSMTGIWITSAITSVVGG